jgi:hypothetical protein
LILKNRRTNNINDSTSSPDKTDTSWTYEDCYDRFYRHKESCTPVEYHGEHNQIKEDGLLIQTWSEKLKIWYCFENMDDKEDAMKLIAMLHRNAKVREKNNTKQG